MGTLKRGISKEKDRPLRGSVFCGLGLLVVWVSEDGIL